MLLRLTSRKILRGDFGNCTICPTSKAVVQAEISFGLIYLCEKCYRAAEQNAKKLAAKKLGPDLWKSLPKRRAIDIRKNQAMAARIKSEPLVVGNNVTAITRIGKNKRRP